MILQPIPYTGSFPVVSAREPYRAQGSAAHRNKLYAACLKAAADPGSEFYHRDSRTGIMYRRSGASHRSAFWAGYDETKTGVINRLKRGAPDSAAAACYLAGKDFARRDMSTTAL